MTYFRNQPIPRMKRVDLSPPHLLPAMIPESMWGVNLRTLLPRSQWDTLRRECYRRASFTCEVCGAVESEMHCNEQWVFIRPELPSEVGIQRLVRLACLCLRCHMAKHLGFASAKGKLEEALDHLTWVNGWSREESYRCYHKVAREWEDNNFFSWHLELSYLARAYGYKVEVTEGQIESARQKYRASTEDTPLLQNLPRLGKDDPISRRYYEVQDGQVIKGAPLPAEMEQCLRNYREDKQILPNSVWMRWFGITWSSYGTFFLGQDILIYAEDDRAEEVIADIDVIFNGKKILPGDVNQLFFIFRDQGLLADAMSERRVVEVLLVLFELYSRHGRSTFYSMLKDLVEDAQHDCLELS